jgi:hypothetical protein
MLGNAIRVGCSQGKHPIGYTFEWEFIMGIWRRVEGSFILGTHYLKTYILE